jgi:hypothetical protein
VKGPGQYYQAPIRFHKSHWMRSLFAMVNFVLLFMVMALPYQTLSQKTYARAMSGIGQDHEKYLSPQGYPEPEVRLEAFKDEKGGWNLHVLTSNFNFSPEHAGKPDAPNEGHGHVFVNGRKAYRIYGPWYHLTLPRGKNIVRVNLTTNTHKDYYSESGPIEASLSFEEDRLGGGDHHH